MLMVEAYIRGEFDKDGIYKDRCRKTFLHCDGDNCKRIYEAIEEV